MYESLWDESLILSGHYFLLFPLIFFKFFVFITSDLFSNIFTIDSRDAF